MRRCTNLSKQGAARKHGQAGWRRLRTIAYVAEKRTGSLAAAIGVSEKQQPYTSMRGARRRCPARREKRYGCRGEAAWDYAYTGKTLRTAWIWRFYGILDPNPVRECRRRDSRSRPGSTGIYEHENGRAKRSTLKESASARAWERKPGGASVGGGAMGP